MSHIVNEHLNEYKTNFVPKASYYILLRLSEFTTFLMYIQCLCYPLIFYADRVFAEYLLYLTNPIWVNLLPMLRSMATKTIERTMAMKRTTKL